MGTLLNLSRSALTQVEKPVLSELVLAENLQASSMFAALVVDGSDNLTSLQAKVDRALFQLGSNPLSGGSTRTKEFSKRFMLLVVVNKVNGRGSKSLSSPTCPYIRRQRHSAHRGQNPL